MSTGGLTVHQRDCNGRGAQIVCQGVSQAGGHSAVGLALQGRVVQHGVGG
jgi:hypothetical protein